VYRHGKTFFPEIAMKLAEHMGKKQLTTRELEVFRLIRDGHRNKQIADVLSIAETIVNFHVKNLVDKLAANDRTHAEKGEGARA
jgi:DNA-binding NarL/FixJ family response regulator